MDHIYTIISYNRKETMHHVPHNILWAAVYIRQIAPGRYMRHVIDNDPNIARECPIYTPRTTRMINTYIRELKIPYKELLKQMHTMVQYERTQTRDPQPYRDAQYRLFHACVMINHYSQIKKCICSLWFNYSFLLHNMLIDELHINMNPSMVFLILTTWVYYIRPSMQQLIEMLINAFKVNNIYLIRIMRHILMRTITPSDRQLLTSIFNDPNIPPLLKKNLHKHDFGVLK